VSPCGQQGACKYVRASEVAVRLKSRAARIVALPFRYPRTLKIILRTVAVPITFYERRVIRLVSPPPSGTTSANPSGQNSTPQTPSIGARSPTRCPNLAQGIKVFAECHVVEWPLTPAWPFQ
jgi:hypothetical protein